MASLLTCSQLALVAFLHAALRVANDMRLNLSTTGRHCCLPELGSLGPSQTL